MGKRIKQKKDAGAAEDTDTKAGGPPIPQRDTLILLVALFLLGLALRLYELGRKPLWLDEASSYFLTTQSNIADVWTAAFNDHHAPLHFIVLWVVRAAGTSEFWLRLPSAVAGACTVIVVFLLARELGGENAGLIAAALLAVSPYHILYSQEARMYGMAVLFVSLAVYFFFLSLRTRSLYHWIVFGGACAAAFYTHFYTSFVILALVLSYGIMRWKEFGFTKSGPDGGSSRVNLPQDFCRFLCGVAVAGILVLPIIGSFFNQSGFFVSRTFNWGLSMGSIPAQTLQMFSYYSGLVALLFLFLMIIALWMVWQKDRRRMAALVFILVVPVLISMYLSQIIPFNVRYHMYLIVIFLSLVAMPLAWIGQKIHRKYGTVAVIAVILAASAIPLSAYYTEPVQEDWRTLSSNLAQVTKPGDIIAPLPWYMVQPLSYYYNNETDRTFYANFPLDEAGFRTVSNRTGTVYFIVTWDITAADPTGYSVRYLNTNAGPTTASVPGIYVLKNLP